LATEFIGAQPNNRQNQGQQVFVVNLVGERQQTRDWQAQLIPLSIRRPETNSRLR